MRFDAASFQSGRSANPRAYARGDLLEAIRFWDVDGHSFARWRSGVRADGGRPVDVTGLSTGKAVFKLFQEFEPERSDLWEAAKTVFSVDRYMELLRIHHPELLPVREVEVAGGTGPLARGYVIRLG
jgi:hypothetical protein